MKRILLHICCGPCAIYPLEVLKGNDYRISGFFYNPNIHPAAEFLKRKEAVEILSKKLALEIFYHNYDVENFFKNIAGNEQFGKRCVLCWQMRMEASANFAKENGFSHFTTTLLVSPYQDQEKIKDIGRNIAGKTGVEFYYEDFRPGFRKAHQKSKEMGLYHQKYCGCIYSEKERFNIKNKNSNIKITNQNSKI